MLGSSGGERKNAWLALDRSMQSAGVSWTDIGDVIENGEGKYSEDELVEYAQAVRAEGVEAGIKIGQTRAGNGGNGAGTLPSAPAMAEYCHQRPSQLTSDWQRDFVADIFVVT